MLKPQSAVEDRHILKRQQTSFDNLTPKHGSICLGVGVGRPSISCGCAIAID